jgi:hypothetical protein
VSIGQTCAFSLEGNQPRKLNEVIIKERHNNKGYVQLAVRLQL